MDQPSRSTASISSASSSRGTTSAIPRTELGVSPLDSPIPRLSKRMTRRAVASRATNSGSQSSIVPRKRWQRSSGADCGSPSNRTANNPSFVGIRVETRLVFQIICGPLRTSSLRRPALALGYFYWMMTLSRTFPPGTVGLSDEDVAQQQEHGSWIGKQRLVFVTRDHAAKGREYDPAEGDMVVTIVRSYATQDVRHIVHAL
jgi:hypothetical protein